MFLSVITPTCNYRHDGEERIVKPHIHGRADREAFVRRAKYRYICCLEALNYRIGYFRYDSRFFPVSGSAAPAGRAPQDCLNDAESRAMTGILQIPVYIINLDRRPDRWSRISARLDRLGIAQTRIPAVDWQDLREREIASRRLLVVAAIANMRSQREALRQFLETSHFAALVLEDDAVLAQDTPTLLRQAEKWWPAGTDIIRLERGPKLPRALYRQSCGQTPTGRKIYRIGRWIGGAAGYMINRRGAERVFQAFGDPVQLATESRSLDHALFDLPVSKLARALRPAQIVPAMVHQEGSASDYDESRDLAQIRGWRWIRWRTKKAGFNLMVYWPARAVGLMEKVEIIYSDNPNVRF